MAEYLVEGDRYLGIKSRGRTFGLLTSVLPCSTLGRRGGQFGILGT